MIASALRVASLAAALAGAVSVSALAQAPQKQAPPAATPGRPPVGGPPVAVGPGWRYELRGDDIHTFHCEQAACVPKSRVSYRLYAPNNSLTLEQFRREQESVVKVLEQRGPPGTRVTILETKGDPGTGARRMFVSRRLIDHADGTKEYSTSSILLGERNSASLISSSLDEKAGQANHSIFAVAVTLLINVSPQRKQ